MARIDTCSHCNPAGQTVVWADSQCRVVLAKEAGFPGWCWAVWNDHVRELSDLTADERNYLMGVVAATERALRRTLAPKKMNLAAMGTGAPHLHWHIVPRFEDDSHFPAPVWGQASRGASQRVLPEHFSTTLTVAIRKELEGSS